MADVFVVIEVSQGPAWALTKAIKCLQEQDADFPGHTVGGWWHKPPDNARGMIARCLSRHGLTGRLSVEPHQGDGAAWNEPPQLRWTGFTAAKRQRF